MLGLCHVLALMMPVETAVSSNPLQQPDGVGVMQKAQQAVLYCTTMTGQQQGEQQQGAPTNLWSRHGAVYCCRETS